MERTKSARSREDLAHQLRQMMDFINTCTLSHLHFPVVRCSGLHSWTHGRDWTSFSFRYRHRSLLSVLNSFMWVYLRSYPLGCAYGNCWNKDGEPTKIFCHFCCLNLCRKTFVVLEHIYFLFKYPLPKASQGHSNCDTFLNIAGESFM